ncbi:MAG TPA: small multi-drug export protein [Thermoplasmata archaeon]|nr:small multi-drug export protein [Thermoplasmata archaeon]
MSVTSSLVELFSWLPDELIVTVISMLPIVELRGALPVGYLALNMPLPNSFAFSILGNLIPVPLIFYLLKPIEKFLRTWKRWDRFFDKLYQKTRARASGKIERYKELGLILFVAIPLPVTGAWTGTLIAYLFGLSFKKSFPVIALGVLIAGGIVSALVYTGKFLWVL